MISTKSTTSTVKLLCSYGGMILPRPSDGLLRYVGGHTRVVSVVRSVSLSELLEKLSEMCGYSVALRCQLPTEEMDVLVSIKSDDDLANIIDEYDRASSISGKELKIRAILNPDKSQSMSNNSSESSSFSFSDLSPTISSEADNRQYCSPMALNVCHQPLSPSSPIGFISDSRSGLSPVRARLPHKFDRDLNQFQPCHVQAQLRPLVLQSNYRQ